MNDELHPLGFDRLLEWMERERADTRTLFGLHEDLWLTDLHGRRFNTARYGRALEAPLGVAAGPHTQLSHNLVAAWLCGARFLELKTVQTLDELTIARPCIDMQDAGYNCEWSQELPIDVSFSEYADAWAAIRALQFHAGVCDADEPGFQFNISVGYDLEGIRGPKVRRFLDAVADARDALRARLERAGAGDVPAPRALSDHVTLSTMHGCPPDEIERIGRHLIEDRGLHTAVKLNPTLLGPTDLRALLQDELGWRDVDVPDAAFAHDMEFPAAVDMIRSLRGAAARAGVEFGVKLTNTLECVNARGVFPDSETMMYLSGRPLHPLTVRVADRLQEAFEGALDVSFSGGADHANLPDLLACGLGPVTVCSDLLRPGGYQRLRQYLETLDDAMAAAGAADLDAFARARAGVDAADPHRANLSAYARAAAADPRYRADRYHKRGIKTERFLDAYDCVHAPCVEACPAAQDVPEYMLHTARGDFEAGLAAVLRDNPFPAVTGMVCDHPCLHRCTRVNMDDVVGIRDVKRFLAHHAEGAPPAVPAAPTGRRVTLVGAGPASLSCAWTLALAGVQAVVLEAKDFPGGMITDAIPAFRLDDEDFASDLRRIEAAGVEVRCGERVDAARFAELRAESDAVFIGVGAQADRTMGVPGEDLPGVVPALGLLSRVLNDPAMELRGEVAVVGGGNTAMDAARTAVRLLGDGRRVHVVYRRDVDAMPADIAEIRAVRAEGVTIHELLGPEAVRARDDGRLDFVCRRMTLGEPDASGRRRPEPTEETVTLVVDTVIPAVGQRLACDFLDPADLEDLDEDLRTPAGDVFVGGDALRGPASLIDAIADGRRAAEAILRAIGGEAPPRAPRAPRTLDRAGWQDRAARMVPAVRPAEHLPAGPGDFGLVIAELTPEQAVAEAARCLDCSDVCDVCVSVCPNRAFVGYDVAPRRLPLLLLHRDGSVERDEDFVLDQARQTAVVADWCNQCGNCTTFCPTAGEPWRDKPRLAADAATFALDREIYLIERAGDDRRILSRHDGREESLTRSGGLYQYETPEARVLLDAADFTVRGCEFLDDDARTVDLRHAAEMAVLLDGLGDGPLARPAAEGA